MEADIRDLGMLFTNSLVSYKGKPVYIVNINEDYTIEYEDIAEGEKGKFVMKSVNDLKSINKRIGYVNEGGFSIYMNRQPYRMYKVGLCKDNTVIIDHVNIPNDVYPSYKISRDLVRKFATPNIVKAINNEYPTLDQAHHQVMEEKKHSVAFDKQFAIDYQGLIYYRGGAVGKFVNGDVVFDKDKTHLVYALKGSK